MMLETGPLRIGIVDRFNPESLTLFQQFRVWRPPTTGKLHRPACLHETHKTLDKGLS